MTAPLTKMLERLDGIIDDLDASARKIKDLVNKERDNIREAARQELLGEDDNA